MSSHGDEVRQRAAALANRLRVVQNSFSEEPQNRREEFLSDEIENAVSSVLPDQRSAFIAALRDEFPLPAALSSASGSPTAPPRPTAPTPEPYIAEPASMVSSGNSWETLTEALIEVAQDLDEDERKELILKLQRGGITVQMSDRRGESARSETTGGLPERAQQALQFLMHKLEISKLDITRLVKVLLLLSDSIGASDNLTWSTWRVVAPRAALRRPCELKKDLATYISGEKSVSGDKIQHAIELQRKLLAALIASIGKLGNNLSSGHLRALFPEEIMAKAAQQTGTRMGGAETKYWQQFVETSQILDSAALEHAIKESIAQTTESLMSQSRQS